MSQSREAPRGSTHAKLRSIPLHSVWWTHGFWAERFEQCHQVMIPNMERLLKDAGISHAYDNFLIAAGKREGDHHGPKWHDGDFYKWLEAVACVYSITQDPALDAEMDAVTEVIGQVQREDGYIHTPVLIQQHRDNMCASEFGDRMGFETYNMGHLMTTGCVHHKVTGKTSLLDIARKAADFLHRVYQESPTTLANNAICPSHYMGLVDMYRTTGDSRYLDLARGLIDIRDLVQSGTDHNQDRIPFREQTHAIGHAVRANYLYAGVADVVSETGDTSLLHALERIWEDVVRRKMYVTGATGALYDGASPDGSRKHSEIQLVHQAYGRPYQLPNVTAYNETCATIGHVLWSARMLVLTGEAKFADALELALYNGVLSGISLDGSAFFYTNPLRRVAGLPFELRWSHTRQPYISCFCCPPNVVRIIAQTHGYAYHLSDGGIWVTLYGSNVLDTELVDGFPVSLKLETDYPWDGKVTIIVDVPASREFALMVRIPGWVRRDASLSVNGRVASAELCPGNYARLSRVWSAGDCIELDLPMHVRLMQAHPLVEELRNQAAVMRGPLVYCLESMDLPSDIEVQDVAIPCDVDLCASFDHTLLDGVTVLEGKALALGREDWSGQLYRELTTQPAHPVDIRLVPYYAWDNRGEGEMTVWMPVR